MSRRGDNIHKRKDGRWEARYKKGVDRFGKTVYGSVYAKTYREAKQKQQEMLSSLGSGAAIPAGSERFGDAAGLWLGHIGIHIKKATEYKYKSMLDTHILPELGSVPLREITATRINLYLAKKMTHGRLDGKGGLSASYVQTMALIMKAILTFAAENKMCGHLQTKIYKPQMSARKLSVLTPEEQKIIDEACLKDTDETKIGVLLSLYAGLRIGEVCALEWDDLDLKERLLHVTKTVSRVQASETDKKTDLIIDHPKTPSSFRVIPLASWMVTVLQELKEKSRSGFVVSSGAGFVSPRTFDYRYRRILAEAGVRSVNFHTLRHTFATRCIESGIDVKSLSEILGHADASITLNTYVHSSMERKRLLLEKLHP